MVEDGGNTGVKKQFWRIKQRLNGNQTETGRPKVTKIDYLLVVFRGVGILPSNHQNVAAKVFTKKQ